MPKRNVYFNNDDVEIWDSLPDGMKSQLLRDFIIEHDYKWKNKEATINEKRRDILRRRIMEKRREWNKWDDLESESQWQLAHLESELSILKSEFREDFGDWSDEENSPPIADDIWDTIYSEAESKIGEVFSSPSGNSEYRIQDVKKGKVMVERMNTSSPKPSTFTSLTIKKAVDRLGDRERIESGHFMPVLAQESAAVFLHPSMSYDGKWVVFERKDR